MSILHIGLALLGGGGIIGVAMAFIPGAAPVIARIFASALAFLSKLPPWVFAVAAALIFALWCLHAKNAQASRDGKIIATWQAKAADSHTAFLREKQQFAIQTANLNAANDRIAEQNRAILAQGATLDQMKRDASAADAVNARRAQTTDVQIAALRSAATQHKTPCTLSDAARRELEN